MWQYIKKTINIYIWNILYYINKHVLYTYPLIEECARCRDCGKNVHDFHVPDDLWQKVIGSEGVWCYDCFCNKADEKLGMKWRLELTDNWYKH